MFSKKCNINVVLSNIEYIIYIIGKTETFLYLYLYKIYKCVEYGSYSKD